MPLSNIVDVQISLELAPVLNAGFGKPAIVGLHTRFGERFREYSDPADMLVDGFLTSDPEYVAAVALMSQPLAVPLFAIGRRATPVAQVVNVTIVGTGNGTYSVTINGVVASFVASGSTAAQIRDGLISAIDTIAGSSALVNVDAAIVSGTVLSITALNAGESFTVSVSSPASDMTAAQSVANVGLQEDLAAIEDAGLAWYATVLTDRDRWDILEAAVWTEGSQVPHILIAQSSEAASRDTVYDAVTGTDLAAVLRQREYNRTALLWHDDDAERADAAWAGAVLPLDPGTETWALKRLVGVTPASLTTTQRNNLVGAETGLGKNANVYYAVDSAISSTWRGQVSSGQWIDLVRAADAITADIAQRLVTLQFTRPKIPLTDGGINSIVAQVAGSLQSFEDDGVLTNDPKYVIDAPRASEISDADRQARRLNPPITFSAQGSGALHELAVRGTISQ